MIKKFFKIKKSKNFNSSKYWSDRYSKQGDSGVGSYGKFAEFKANTLNEFVKDNEIASVIEFGCGDGNQLSLSVYPTYIGFDVSDKAIEICNKKFVDDISKEFKLVQDYAEESAELCLSLDVIFHLTENEVYDEYMKKLFQSAKKFVIIYSSNEDKVTDDSHVVHRKFSDWVESNQKSWELKEFIKNKYPYNGNYKESSFSDFFIYEKTIS